VISGPGTEIQINQVYGSQNFQAIGLDYWGSSNQENVSIFQQSTGISYPLCISASATKTLYQAYEDLDVSIVIDQAGILRYRGGGVNVSEITSMIDNLIGVSAIEDQKSPTKFRLHQNYPNPFNPSTIISFEISHIEKVSLIVYDNQGRFIRSLLNNTMHTGKHEISWDGRNNQGESVSAGVYYYRLHTAGFNLTKKMTLIR
jgi:hypothetical protein